MASEQQVHSSAALDEMINVAKSMTVLAQQNGTMAAMRNDNPIALSLLKSKDWAGSVSMGSYPDWIAGSGGSERFKHEADATNGSKGAVIYSGLNKKGIECAWLLAWYAPNITAPSTTPNKVFIQCGAKDQIDALDWDTIEVRLDAAINPQPIYKDRITGTTVDAMITDGSNLAALAAVFGDDN